MAYDPKSGFPPQRIVCAANRHQNGTIVLGARHFDELMHKAIADRKISFPNETWVDCEQGFIDQYCNFLTRKEAWVIALVAKQIFRLVGNQHSDTISDTDIKLYSENLY